LTPFEECLDRFGRKRGLHAEPARTFPRQLGLGTPTRALNVAVSCHYPTNPVRS